MHDKPSALWSMHSTLAPEEVMCLLIPSVMQICHSNRNDLWQCLLTIFNFCVMTCTQACEKTRF